MINFIIIRGLRFNRYQISEYMITFFYFPGSNYIVITSPREIYIVDDFKINIFININIMILKKIDIFIF